MNEKLPNIGISRQSRLVVFFACFAVFALPPLAAEIEPFSIETTNSRALGGYHAASENDIFCLFGNPAALEIVQYRGFVRFGIGAAGNLNEDAALLNTIFSGSKIDAAIATEYGKKNLGFTPPVFYINGPFAVAYAAKGFGIGVFNRLYWDSAISNNQWTINFNNDIIGTAGWSITFFDTYNNKLHAGISGKVFNRYMSNIKSQNITVNKKAAATESPGGRADKLVFGVGINAGMLYSFRDFFSAGITCDDLITPYFFIHLVKDNGNESFIELPHQKLNIGLSLKPVQNNGIFLNIMADFRDVLSAVGVFSTQPQDILLYISAGVECVFMDRISLRAGIKEMYPSAGIGYNFGAFSINAAFYGKEYGLFAGDCTVYAFELGLTIN
ncbi:MAG: hypothetical protein LBG74_01270 [Spirochaetaceae bacterium]|nr:hypothetical protein [Spirochaetaceae bacterium]